MKLKNSKIIKINWGFLKRKHYKKFLKKNKKLKGFRRKKYYATCLLQKKKHILSWVTALRPCVWPRSASVSARPQNITQTYILAHVTSPSSSAYVKLLQVHLVSLPRRVPLQSRDWVEIMFINSGVWLIPWFLARRYANTLVNCAHLFLLKKPIEFLLK